LDKGRVADNTVEMIGLLSVVLRIVATGRRDDPRIEAPSDASRLAST
jgi:hypothetical protein